MKKSLLFALDAQTEETLVSESQKGSNKIQFIERIPRSTNELLYDSVAILTKISQPSQFDAEIFKAVDKVCQLMYNKFIENREQV